MYLIVGLGNPGSQYENTRHNVGFLTIDYLADMYDIKVKKYKFDGLYGQGEISGQKVMLLKPQTYMNNSGTSVRDFYNYFNIEKDKLIVITDDIDIDFGRVKIKKKGSAGTHNGMKSIIYHLQFDDFTRIKIAVGKNSPDRDLANFVLSYFSQSEVEIIREEIKLASKSIELILSEGLDRAMNYCNSINLIEDGGNE